MGINYVNLTSTLAREIDSQENQNRKNESLKEFEIFSDRIDAYVADYLKKFYKEDDIKDLPLVSSINLCRRIVKQEASIYKCAPTRTFSGVSDEQKAVLLQVYEDMRIDSQLQKSNEYFKLQAQNNLQIIPKNGKLSVRVLLNHQFDVVPKFDFPEEAGAYILSGMNKLLALPDPVAGTDGINETIADAQDWMESKKLYVLWSDEQNFIFNEQGMILSVDMENPIKLSPFVDISPAKDFEFFIRQGSSVTEFTVQFNAALTDMSQIMRMQGFAQSYIIAHKDAIPTSMRLGPNFCIKLPINPDLGADARPEFGFAQPNADLDGSMKFLESLVAMFLTSRGLDPKTISASGNGKAFTSGMERLLSMIEKFEATRSDFNIYMDAEKKIFQIVKAYLNTYAGTNVLKYKIAPLSEDADVDVKYEEPEMVETEDDKINRIEKKLELGLMTKIEAIMEDRDVDEDEAMKVQEKIQQDAHLLVPQFLVNDPNLKNPSGSITQENASASPQSSGPSFKGAKK